MKKIAALLATALIAIGLVGCSNTVTWYQLDKLLSMEPSAIVNQLEEGQGFEYELEAGELGEEDDRYEWQGVPKLSKTLIIRCISSELIMRC